MRWYVVVLGLLVVYLLISFSLVSWRENFYYSYTPDYPGSEADKYPSIILPRTGTHVIFIDFEEPGDSTRNVVLYCHGNGGNVAVWSKQAAEIARYYRCKLVLFDYPKFGRSSPNTPLIEENVYRSAADVVQYLLSKEGGEIPRNKIVALGVSMGGAVAMRVARDFQLRHVIAVATPYSFGEMGKKLLPGMFKWLGRFLPEYNTASHLREYLAQTPNGHVTIVHSIEDDLVPYSQAEQMVREADSGRVKLITVTGKHNNPQINWGDINLD